MLIHDDSTERASGNLSDPALPPLSPAEAAHLVRLSLEAAATAGLTGHYDNRGALILRTTLPDGQLEAGLTNLARIVADERPDYWPRLVGEHFDRLADLLRRGAAPRPTDPQTQLIQRLAAKDSLDPLIAAGAPEFVPGLLSVPAMSTTGAITMYLAPELDLGLTWAEAESFGLRNLRAMTDTVSYAEHDGTYVAMISGSNFAASRALVLDTVLRESLHVENPPYGVLAAMPVRDLLLVHVITDLSVLQALGMMLNLAGRSHATNPGPLSPWVYLVAADGWHPTTRPADNSDPGLSPRFLTLLRELSQLT
ncbi:hypothetical protein GCM10009554_33190 [Kribbella koreensis]|uniref:Uncharacterized protein n=1 Tax=Kribbella koreensis TaxID=57909 RepID=A0ABP4AVK2_9ACTN